MELRGVIVPPEERSEVWIEDLLEQSKIGLLCYIIMLERCKMVKSQPHNPVQKSTLTETLVYWSWFVI